MKKLYASISMLTFCLAGFAQQNQTPTLTIKQNKHNEISTVQNRVTPASQNIQRNEISLWTNDFSDATDWTSGVIAGASAAWPFLHCLPPTFCPLTYPGSPAHLLPILSPTAANGYAYINSDQAGPGALIDTWIEYTGTIDLQGNSSIFVRFNEFLTSFREETWVEISTDNGISWQGVRTDGFNTGGSIIGNRSAVKQANLSAFVNGADEIKLRFRYVADWDWYWFIDDVEVFASTAPNASIVRAHFNTYFAGNDVGREDEQEFSVMTINEETSMITPIVPIAVVENTGGALLTNLILTATINGPNDFVQTLVSTPSSLSPAAFDTIACPSYTFQATDPVGLYTINYTLTAEETFENPEAATATRELRLSDLEFGKGLLQFTGTWTNTTTGLEENDNPNGNYSIGASFYMFDDANVYQLGVMLSSLSDPGLEFELELFEVNAGAETFIASVQATSTEAMFDQMVYFDLDDFEALDEGTVVRLYLSYFEEGSGDKTYVRLAGNSPGQLNYIRFENVSSNCCTISSVPMLRMGLNEAFVSVPEIAKGEFVKTRSFPNPFNNSAQIQFILAENAHVQIDLLDITGKLISSNNLGVVAGGVTHFHEIKGESLTSGMYLYSLIVNGERTTKKMIKN
ncbi:MAG: T9SS type A sorting domain-containing protein [Luteibaculaceae bacterium]